MAGDSGLRVVKGGTGRNFQLEGAKVIQTPDNYFVGPFKAEFGIVKGELRIGLGLSYIATVDPGQNRLLCRISLERPARWRGSRSETLAIEREFLYLYDVVDWLFGLETAIMGALFNDHCNNNRVVKDREAARVLLAIVDQLKPLGEALKEEEKVRKKMLERN